MNRHVDPLPCVGERVVLRRLGVLDLPAFQAYRSDARLGRYQGWTAMPDAEALAFLQDMHTCPLFRPGEWTQVGIAQPHDPRLAGDMGLYLAPDSRQAEIGFTLARHAHGRGLATAAVLEAMRLIFELTTVEHIIGVTDARNHASIAVLERAGMCKDHERGTVLRGEPCIELIHVRPRHRG